jgi:hypothetical protein
MFFSFVVNTGVLVTAKISVQNAADAAAYAGAATQARQLNAISYLNYDMRRQFKKFVYRYAFMGNIAARNFPNLPQPNSVNPAYYGYPKDYFPSSSVSSMQTIPINVPVVCIPLTGTSSMSDNCVKLNLPSSVAQASQFFPGGGGLTQLTQQFLQATAQIQGMQEAQCGKTSTANLFVLIEWLMRGDISPAAISNVISQMTATNTMSAVDKQKLTDTITNLVHGLGLYPRNIINLMRIETLEKFLNASAKKDIQKDSIESMEGDSQNAEVNERTIQAFKSALSNLNNEVIKHDTVIMQELQNDNQIIINAVKPSFNAYVQYMNEGSGGTDPTICNSKIIPFRAKSAPAGVVKASTAPVHYAVKISAKAKLLFLPIKDGIELEAFASAKPFGSRIGPANLSDADFVENIKPNPVGSDIINDCTDAMTKCNVPIMKVLPNETYYSPAYLKTLIGIGATPVTGGGLSFKMIGLENGMAPQPIEVGHYNIIPPITQAAEMKYEFLPFAKDGNSKIYRFYAPIFTGGGNPTQKITDFMDEVFGLTQVTGTGQFSGVDMMALKATLQSELIAYVTGPLNAGGNLSEHGETTTFAAIELPMAPNTPIAPNPQKYWLTTSNEVLSSWAPPYSRLSTGPGFRPRFGYSVKFVAMQNLLQGGMNEADSDEGKVSH